MDIKRANIVAYGEEAEKYDKAMGRHLKDPIFESKRASSLIKYASVLPKRPKLLELGAGTGFGRAVIQKVIPEADYFAIDISFEMLQKYKIKFYSEWLIVGDAENIPVKDKQFDMVFCSSFIHHLPTEDILLSEVYRILKPGGIFVSLSEPCSRGCDFWFRVKHIPRRYGDRSGLKMLLRRLFGGPSGWKQIWSYEMAYEDFIKLDSQEIRGAILHPTPTKKSGGVDPELFNKNASKYFKKVTIIKYGFFTSMLESFSILWQKSPSLKLMSLADNIDNRLSSIFKNLPFESFSSVCKAD